MSTIIKYKDNVLADFENGTKIIKTGNKWLEDNLILVKTDSLSNADIYQDEDEYLVINKDGDSSSVKTTFLNTTENGTYNAGSGMAYDSIRVRVPISNVMKSIIDRSVTSITTADLPKVTVLGPDAFNDCAALTSFDVENITSIGDRAFQNCTSLTSFHGKNVSNVGQYVFQGSGITTFVSEVPMTGGIYNTFYGADSLTAVDITFTGSISNGFFRAIAVTTIVLRNPTVCTLGGTGAFTNSPFASGKAGGTLYVPSSLVSSYTSASNWSTILGYETNQILPIEGSIYETQYADGTAITQGGG